MEPRPCLNMKTVFPRYVDFHVFKIRRSWDRLIFNMGIPILVRLHLFIATSPRLLEDFPNYVFFYSTIRRRNSKSRPLEWTLQLPILYIQYILWNVRCLFGVVLFKWSHCRPPPSPTPPHPPILDIKDRYFQRFLWHCPRANDQLIFVQAMAWCHQATSH